MESAGLTNGFALPAGSDQPDALRDAARAKAMEAVKATTGQGTVASIEEMNFADVVAEIQDKDGEGTPLTGRASAGVSLSVRYIP